MSNERFRDGLEQIALKYENKYGLARTTRDFRILSEDLDKLDYVAIKNDCLRREIRIDYDGENDTYVVVASMYFGYFCIETPFLKKAYNYFQRSLRNMISVSFKSTDDVEEFVLECVFPTVWNR